MAELKKCPFCGGEADIEEIAGNPYTDESYAWGVGCKKCNIGWYEETKEKAITMWNRRPAPENKALTLETMQKDFDKHVYCQTCQSADRQADEEPCRHCKGAYPSRYRRKPEEAK